MVKHFDTLAAAFDDLRAHGWRKINSGKWISADKDFVAMIHPVPGGNGVVAVSYQELA